MLDHHPAHASALAPSPAAAADPFVDPLADPVGWPDDGGRWVEEPRRRAPSLDAFMAHVHRLGAEQIMFSTWQPASFRLYGQNHKAAARPPLDENDAAMIVNHLYGA